MFEIYEKPIEQSLSNLESVDDFNASDAEEFEIIWFCDNFFIYPIFKYTPYTYRKLNTYIQI